MATTKEYIEFVCDQIQEFGEVRYRKMFGEYMAYLNDKPDDGAKEHYILDVEDRALVEQVLPVLEQVVPVPKKRKKE